VETVRYRGVEHSLGSSAGSSGTGENLITAAQRPLAPTDHDLSHVLTVHGRVFDLAQVVRFAVFVPWSLEQV
jgi:hypothetical protein